MNGFGGIPKIKMLTFLPPTFFLKNIYKQRGWGKLVDLNDLAIEDRKNIMHGRYIFLRALASNMPDNRRKPKWCDVEKAWTTSV